ncbi:MAG: DEAD/DEAH box helicase [Sedimentisphaerales bacterium]|nr:DEAD/DEAH box helicase [Sedimentisphaerales bacterium]
MNNNRIDPAWFLGSQGPIARYLNGYEVRHEQVAMAQAIQQAFSSSQHLVVEAGTGVGKSFAYLIPAIQRAVENKQKVVISTYTIALQEQLTRKDVPFIHEIADHDFLCVLAKGRGNYFCWRRFEHTKKRGGTLFDSEDQFEELSKIYSWALETKDGSRSSMQDQPSPAVWEQICSDSTVCMGRKCPHVGICFYQQVKRRIFGADIIITNHALLFSDLAAKLEGGAILPKFELLILDEAHNVENVASTHFGLRITNHQISYLLNRIYNPRTGKGIVTPYCDNMTIELLADVTDAAEKFFASLQTFDEVEKSYGGNGRVQKSAAFVNVLSRPLIELGQNLHNIAAEIEDEQDQMEIDSYSVRCLEMADAIKTFIDQQIGESVYWVEASQRRYRPTVAACASPLHVGSTLQKALFSQCSTVVLTSATIATGSTKPTTKNPSATDDAYSDQLIAGTDRPPGFDFFCSRLGLEECLTLQLGSPFDYQSQVEVFVEASLPDPSQKTQDFLDAAAQCVKKYLEHTMGKAFLLFTSFKQLDQMAQELQSFCQTHNLTLLAQGKGKDRSQLLDQFRENTNSILLGTDSFWQGVDVPGESLSNVIIVKLPFSVPDHPLLQARLEQIKSQGGNPFFDYQLPEAILKFKQGFGRLIRSKTDTGIVVILDPRVVTKRYGKAFLRALPPCPVNIRTNNTPEL